MDWREAMRGVQPWIGAWVIQALTKAEWSAGLTPTITLVTAGRPMQPGEVIDLSDPDTRAAFDRRLALRLGAPQESADEGVIFSRVHATCWEIVAGAGDRWWARTLTQDELGAPFPDDALSARALAWRSVA